MCAVENASRAVLLDELYMMKDIYFPPSEPKDIQDIRISASCRILLLFCKSTHHASSVGSETHILEAQSQDFFLDAGEVRRHRLEQALVHGHGRPRGVRRPHAQVHLGAQAQVPPHDGLSFVDAFQVFFCCSNPKSQSGSQAWRCGMLPVR